MPSSRVGLPSVWWVPSIRRGIIRESALCPLCRRRHKGHWTGHPERLYRDLKNPFGSAGYAREELRAEIASLILGSELGIGYGSSKHASYVDHWIQILTESPKEILYAAADAERISEYILRIEERQKAGTQETHEARQAKRDL